MERLYKPRWQDGVHIASNDRLDGGVNVALKGILFDGDGGRYVFKRRLFQIECAGKLCHLQALWEIRDLLSKVVGPLQIHVIG